MLEPRLCCTMVGVLELAGEFLVASWVERWTVEFFFCRVLVLLCPFAFKNVSRQMRRVDSGLGQRLKYVVHSVPELALALCCQMSLSQNCG